MNCTNNFKTLNLFTKFKMVSNALAADQAYSVIGTICFENANYLMELKLTSLVSTFNYFQLPGCI